MRLVFSYFTYDSKEDSIMAPSICIILIIANKHIKTYIESEV